jgi:hypothetical protein
MPEVESKIKMFLQQVFMKVCKFSVINISILRYISTCEPQLFLYFSQHIKLHTDATSGRVGIKTDFDFMIADDEVSIAYLQNAVQVTVYQLVTFTAKY